MLYFVEDMRIALLKLYSVLFKMLKHIAYCTLHWYDELSDDHPEIEEYYVDNIVYSL